MFGFPFETITTAVNRAAVMDRVLDFFGVVPIVPTGDFDADGFVDGADFLAWQRGFGAANPTLADGDADRNGVVDGADLATWASQFGNGEAVGAAAVAAFAALEADEEFAPMPAPTEQLGWLAQRTAATNPATTPRQAADLQKQASLRRTDASPRSASSEREQFRRRPFSDSIQAHCLTGELDSIDLAFHEQSLGADDWNSLQ
jgi:hypothetical protein